MPRPNCHWCGEIIYGTFKYFSPSGAYEFCSDECLFRWKVRDYTGEEYPPSDGEAIDDGFTMMALAEDDNGP